VTSWCRYHTGLVSRKWHGLSPARIAVVPRHCPGFESSLRDRDSNSWVGTTRGLLRITRKAFRFSKRNDLRGDGGISVLFEDREGNLWIGGARGLGRIRDSAFVTYSSVSDRRFEHNGPVYVDPEGRTWLAPAQGWAVWFCQNGRVQPLTSIPLTEVSSIPSVDGQMSCGSDVNAGGLTRLRFRNGAIESQSYTEATDWPKTVLCCLMRARWLCVGRHAKTAASVNSKMGTSPLTYTTANGLASNTASSHPRNPRWCNVVCHTYGLSSFSNGQWKIYTTVEGLPSPEVNCLFEDSSGTLWSGTSAGLCLFFASNRLSSSS